MPDPASRNRPPTAARSGQRTRRSCSMPKVTSSPPPSRSPSGQAGARDARTAMAAVSTEAPTRRTRRPSMTPEVLMRARSLRRKPRGQGNRQRVDGVTNQQPEGVVQRQTAPTKDDPRRGTSGAVGAPDSGGRSWCAGTLNPKGECAYPNDEPFGGPNANGAQTTQVARPARR